MNFYFVEMTNEDKKTTLKCLDAPYRKKWCDAWEVDRKNGDSDKCPLCGRNVSMLKWLEPRMVRLIGTNYPDRLASWLTEPLVVSERFVNAYIKDSLIGISEFIPIEIVKSQKSKESVKQPPKYYCAEIGFDKSVYIDIDQSIIIGQKYDWSCPLCNPFGTTIDKIVKVVLNTKNWSGKDVFKVYSLGTIVSQKFYDFVSKYEFTNISLTPIEEYQR